MAVIDEPVDVMDPKGMYDILYIRLDSGLHVIMWLRRQDIGVKIPVSLMVGLVQAYAGYLESVAASNLVRELLKVAHLHIDIFE